MGYFGPNVVARRHSQGVEIKWLCARQCQGLIFRVILILQQSRTVVFCLHIVSRSAFRTIQLFPATVALAPALGIVKSYVTWRMC